MPHFSSLRFGRALAFAALAFAPFLMAQSPATPQAQRPVFTANAGLVNMQFSVEGKHGAYVPDLGESDFRVLEEGRRQSIRFFSAEHELPLTLGLLLDTSPSQQNVLGQEQRLSDQFFRQVVSAKDLAFVVGFDVDTTLLQDLTSSPELLARAVDAAHIGGGGTSLLDSGPLPQAGSRGSTHLWDAIYLACHDEMRHQVGRKALIVVTDGGEQGSTYTDQDALRAALESNTVVFAILAADRHFGGYGGFIGSGPGQLRKLAESTGGRVIDAGDKLAPAYQRIQDELRSQYTLGYHPDLPLDGKFHAVKIELTPVASKAHPDSKVRARTGYYALPPGS